jgi:LAS superfamily LD-carboxypeptidase LdcB
MKTKWKIWVALCLVVGIALLVYFGFYQSRVKEIRLMTSVEDLRYVEGLPPDFSKLSFEVTFENGKMKTVLGNRLTYSDVAVDTLGEQRVVGTYGNQEISFSIWIREKVLVSIEIIQPPTAVSYIQGQSVQLEGIQVKGHFDNSEVQDLSTETLIIGEYDKEHIGVQEISVYVGDQADAFQVEYAPKTLLGLTLITPPSKQTYPEKVNLDLTGLQVEALYDNGIPELVSHDLLSVVGFDKAKIGTQTVTLQFQGQTATFTVVVEPKKETGISIVSKPTKVVYERSEPFAPQGLTVALRYNNGEQVMLDPADVTVSGFSTYKVGTQTLTVRYGAFQANFEVKVNPYMVPNPDALDVVVNKDRALSSGFVPSGLVKVNVSVVYASTEGNKMKSGAAAALYELFASGHEAGITLLARSGYRSYNTQSTLYANSVKNNGLAYANRYTAQPGHSEHQTGLAMDVTAASVNNALVTAFGSTKEGVWLAANAHRFGFIIRYPNGKESITGYAYEPWHIRYVGKDVAAAVYQRGVTLEEYFGLR